MRTTSPLTILALAALFAAPLAAAEAAEKPGPSPAAPSSGAAMKAHVDPATGQLVSPPKASEPAPREPLATQSLPDLKVEKVTAKAGGKKVNLQGRFMMESKATVAADGTLRSSCTQVVEPAATGGAPAKEHRHDR